MKLTMELLDSLGFGQVRYEDNRIVRSYVGDAVEYKGMTDVWVLFRGKDSDLGFYSFDARTERSLVEFLQWWCKVSEEYRDSEADEYAWINKEN